MPRDGTLKLKISDDTYGIPGIPGISLPPGGWVTFPGGYEDPVLEEGSGEAIYWGPIGNSYGMVQPDTGSELHTVAIPPDVFVTCYVEDDLSGTYYGGVDDRQAHMVVAGRVNPDLSITFGSPAMTSTDFPGDYFADISDLCYVGNNVVMIGNRRNPPATFLHVDTTTLAITEIGAIYSPAMAGGETSPGNAVKAMSNHDGNALVIFDYDSGGGYWMAWVTTDGSSISYTWDNAPSDEVGYWFTWATSHWVPVADGVVASGAYGALHYIIDWAGQSISFVHVSATDMWTSFAEESAVTTPAPGSSTYDLVWVTTTDTLRFAAGIPIGSTTATSTWSPIGGQRIGQATAQPYAYFTDMARLPDQSFILTWLANDGYTRNVTWFRPGQSLETRPIYQIAGSSFWYYDGTTVDYVGNGRFVLAWTENKEGVEDWGNEIYWRVGQLAVPSEAPTLGPQAGDAFPGPAVTLNEAGSATTDTVDTELFTLEAGEPNTEGTYDISIGKTAWWSFTPEHTGDYLVTTRPSQFKAGYDDPGVAVSVYTGSAVNGLTLLASDSDYMVERDAYLGAVVLTMNAGTTYRIQVGTWEQTTGDPSSAWPVFAAIQVAWVGLG